MALTTAGAAACAKCRFFDSEASADLGLCRYNPPISQPSGTPPAYGRRSKQMTGAATSRLLRPNTPVCIKYEKAGRDEIAAGFFVCDDA